MKKYLFLFLLILISSSIFSQDDSSRDIRIVTKEGTVIVGKMIKETATDVTVLSETLGEITILRVNITTIDFDNQGAFILDEEEDYYNSTRSLVSPSGFLLKKGQSYYENVAVFFNSYAVGITDNFNIAMGGELASLLFGEQFPILYVSPKFGVPISDVGAWSIGSTIFTSPSDEFRGFGFINTSLSIGNRNNHFTIGTGLGFDFSSGVSDNIVPIMIGGNFRLSRKISLVTDNFIILYDNATESQVVVSLGARIHFTNGAAINLALWRPTEDLSDIIAFPFVSATVPLGRAKN